MQYILTGVIVLIFSGLVIHGLTLLLERGYRALFGFFAGAAVVPRKVKMKVPR
ncbi:TPA: phosphatidate cytidylyltransferase [Klebsiella quasipneumoniae subsp. similipneumoniae]|nr:phosphatidate cytidylyltransferase [Klebsiella quasipneumoniae subsp. similipneumoniae]